MDDTYIADLVLNSEHGGRVLGIDPRNVHVGHVVHVVEDADILGLCEHQFS